MENRPYSRSLRGKITNRTLLIGILPVLLVGAFSWWSLTQLADSVGRQLEVSRTELLDSVVGNNLRSSASNVVHQLDNFMLERISDVIVWASAPVVLRAARAAAQEHQQQGLVGLPIEQVESRFRDRKSLQLSPAADRYLANQIRFSSHFGEIFFTDEYGFNTAMTNPTSDFVQRDENWWKAAWQNGISVGEVEFDDSAGIWSVDISVRIDDNATGNSLGVMKAVLGVSLIQEVADAGALDVPGSAVTVISNSGLLLAETSSEHDPDRIMVEGVNFRESSDPGIQRVFSGEPSGYVLAGDRIRGFAQSAGPELYRTVVSRFPGFNWTVVVEQPTSLALAPIEGLVKVQASLDQSKLRTTIVIVIVSLLVVAAAVLVAGMLSRAITSPLMALRDLADAASKGDIKRSIEIDSDDEIQDLAQAFERMRTSVSIILSRMKKARAGRS